ncbi:MULTISPECIES: hypothetical protein [Stenotrophomonas]|uniref:hypothetical protein n=1 Tax=Stenotrophomonas TaxID=40323 RepID=UPI000C19A231|nr:MULTISPECIES: hypothetical protein [Stenotrophomonas]MDN8648231.1 hypothetical protein [Stenotrophomonas indicatrix]MDR6695458.1 hypothetical protein [Stenotrophomonas sp. 1337]PII14353.1 hypothetical protein CR920_00390 [Stenotrophomonas indicatrix]QXQ02977.1 hypothetical protein KX724_02305 [Stenotrophomonas indicatrix]
MIVQLQRVLVTLVVLGVLVACRASSAPEVAPTLLTPAQAAARTVVPFTRAVQLQKAGRIAEVTFDLPAPQKPAIPILNVGLRLQETDARRLLDASEKITLGRLPTRLRLERIDASTPGPVQLWQRTRDGRDSQKIPDDGVVTDLTTGSVDINSLAEAGLYSEEVLYRTLQLAQVGGIAPGRYVLVVDLVEDRPELEGLKAELIVGYQSLGK